MTFQLLYSDETGSQLQIMRFDDNDNLETYDPADSAMWVCDAKYFSWEKRGMAVAPPEHRAIVSDSVGNDYQCIGSCIKVMRNGTAVGSHTLFKKGMWSEIAVNGAGTRLAIRDPYTTILIVYKIIV